MALEHYDWLGNVRELRKVVEAMLLLASEQTISFADVPAELWGGTAGAPAASSVVEAGAFVEQKCVVDAPVRLAS